MSTSVDREYDRYFIRKFFSEWGMPRLRPGVSVLDAGSGNRAEQMFRQQILDRGAELTTCDAKANDGVDLVVDLHSLPLPDAKFDLLLCIQVLEHVRHPDKACAEFYRVLKPGGVAIVTVPQITQTLTDGTPPHYFNFTRHGIEACLVYAGFTITATEAQGGHFCALGTLLHYSVKVLGDSSLPKWSKAILIPCCRVAFGLIGKAFFRAIDHLDTKQRSSLGWNICATKPAAP